MNLVSSLTDEDLKSKFLSISEEFKVKEENFKSSNQDNVNEEDYLDKSDQFRKDFLDNKGDKVYNPRIPSGPPRLID